MINHKVLRSISALLLCVCAASALALDGAVPAIHGDVSRNLLGNGTGVIIGIVDSGVDDLHPTLAGLDSLGSPRMVAESNFVTSEPGNTGDDVFGHGTWVASAALGSAATFTGMATDARYVNARVLNNSNGFPNDTPVRNGLGFAINQGANVVNLSLNFAGTNSGGFSQLDLMVDWAAFDRRINCAVCVGNISQASSASNLVRGPGSAFNGVTVGRTTADFTQVHPDSATAFTSFPNRMKPDVVAPGAALTLANDDWEGAAADWDMNLGGCSFATPLVAGLMAQQIEAGMTHGHSADPLVVKATMMNSAAKVLDKQGNAWEPSLSSNNGGLITAIQSLDNHSVAGQVDGNALATQYLAGEKTPGFVDPIGWDFNVISAVQAIDYVIDPNLILGSTLSATLTWYRHVGRTDNGNGIVDANDTFFQQQTLSNLDLQVLRNGLPVAQSISTIDNVEHLFLSVDQSAQYTLRVFGENILGAGEEFALAWHSVAVPEPASFLLLAIAAVGAFVVCHRSRHLAMTSCEPVPVLVQR